MPAENMLLRIVSHCQKRICEIEMALSGASAGTSTLDIANANWNPERRDTTYPIAIPAMTEIAKHVADTSSVLIVARTVSASIHATLYQARVKPAHLRPRGALLNEYATVTKAGIYRIINMATNSHRMISQAVLRRLIRRKRS